MTYGVYRLCACNSLWDGAEGKHGRRYGGIAECGCAGLRNCQGQVIEVQCTCITCSCGAQLAGNATVDQRDAFEVAHLFCPRRAA